MDQLQKIYDAIAAEGFSAGGLVDEQTFLDSLFQSMQESAREVRLSLGRPSSQATREQALRQVQMLQEVRDARLGSDEAIQEYLQAYLDQKVEELTN